MYVTAAIVTPPAGTGLDLDSDPYRLLGDAFAPKLPDARLNDFGRSAQMAGAPKFEAHYDEPPWEISVGVDSPDRASIDALTNAFAPGAVLTWGDETGVATTRITTVECAEHESWQGWTVLTFSGTRRPAWDTISYPFSGTVAWDDPVLVLPEVGGELCAKMSLLVIASSSVKTLSAAIKSAPASGYTVLDDYSGVAESPTIGGERTGTAHTSGPNFFSFPQLAPTIDSRDNSGSHHLLARVWSDAPAGSISFRAGNAAGGVTRWEPPVRLPVSGTWRVLPLASVDMPVVAFPALTMPSTGEPIVQHEGEAKAFPSASVWQTVTFAEAALLTSISFKVTNPTASTATFSAQIQRASGDAPGEAWYSFWEQEVLAGQTAVLIWALNTPAPIAMGTALAIRCTGSAGVQFWRTADDVYPGGRGGYGTETPGDGTDSTIDLWFEVGRAALSFFDASNPVQFQASQSGSTRLDAVCRVPADHGGFVVTSDGMDGAVLDPDLRAVYPTDDTGAVVGGSLAGTMTPLGTELAPAPGVENRLVVWGDAESYEVSGLITERRIHRG